MNIKNKRKYDHIYGAGKISELDAAAQMLKNITLGEYMERFPNKINGLWSIVEKVSPKS